MAAHLVENVVYLTDEWGRDSGGGITCTCGWHDERRTHADVAASFADHRREHGLSPSAKAGLTKNDGTLPARVWSLT